MKYFTKEKLTVAFLCSALSVAALATSYFIGYNTTFWGSLLFNSAPEVMGIVIVVLLVEYLLKKENTRRLAKPVDLARSAVKVMRTTLIVDLAYVYQKPLSRDLVKTDFGDKAQAKQFLETFDEGCEAYLNRIDLLSHELEPRFIGNAKQSILTAKHRIEEVLSLYGYALEETERDYLLDLRQAAEIAEKAFALTSSEGSHDHQLLRTVFNSIYKNAGVISTH